MFSCVEHEKFRNLEARSDGNALVFHKIKICCVQSLESSH